jgi:hypothetical protein
MRFVEVVNHRYMDSKLSRIVPHQLQNIGRVGEEEISVIDSWNEFNQIILPQEKLSQSNSEKLAQLRVIYNPMHDETITYPDTPDRTINYFRSANVQFDVTQTKTLLGSLNSMDLQRWDDVVIREIWLGGQNKMSMLTSFFETLQRLATTRPAPGKEIAWIPYDLSFARHFIQPIEIKAGEVDVDIVPVRQRYDTDLDSYIDRQVTFTFKLVRPQFFPDSNITMDGA